MEDQVTVNVPQTHKVNERGMSDSILSNATDPRGPRGQAMVTGNYEDYREFSVGKFDFNTSSISNEGYPGGNLDELYEKVGQNPKDPMQAVFAAGMREWRRTPAGLSSGSALSIAQRIDRAMMLTVAREFATARGVPLVEDIVGLDAGECAAEAAMLWGCEFDETGNETACGTATVDKAAGTVTISKTVK